MDYTDCTYKYSFWDLGWMALGVGIFVAAIITGLFELFFVAIPIILLTYKNIMLGRALQDAEDENDELLYGKFTEINYAQDYFICDAVDNLYLDGKRL